MFKVNVFGAVNIIKAFLPGMIEAGPMASGKKSYVVTTSSVVGLLNHNIGPYSVSKFATTALCEQLSIELEGMENTDPGGKANEGRHEGNNPAREKPGGGHSAKEVAGSELGRGATLCGQLGVVGTSKSKSWFTSLRGCTMIGAPWAVRQ